jgi:hypothetical protein
VAELVTLQDDYRAWLDSLPDNLAESATADALRAICDLDLLILCFADVQTGKQYRLSVTHQAKPDHDAH